MIALFVWMLGACAPDDGDLTETGNPELRGSMHMLARTTAPQDVSVGAGGTVSVASAEVAVERVRLVMGDVCDAPGEVEWDVPAPPVVELVGGSGPLAFDARAGDYCRMRIRLEGEEVVTRVEGARGDGVGFLIESTAESEVDVRSRGEPFPLEEGAAALLLAFDVAAWMEGLDLEAAPVGTGGIVLIDAATDPARLAQFDANVSASLALFSDVDGDDEVGGDDEEVARSD